MNQSKIEIECFLNLYPIAAVKVTKMRRESESYFGKFDEGNRQALYSFIVATVERWLDCLYEDERLIIQYRYFERYNYSQIAIKTNYSNHSCVLKKKDAILKKIQNSFFEN